MKKLIFVCALAMFWMTGAVEALDLRGLYAKDSTCDLSQKGAKYVLVANDGAIVTDQSECTVDKVKLGPFPRTISVKLVCNGDQVKEKRFDVWRYSRKTAKVVWMPPVEVLSVNRKGEVTHYYKCPTSNFSQG